MHRSFQTVPYLGFLQVEGASGPRHCRAMTVYCNGEFVRGEDARISVFDRCFAYGDGLFETLPVRNAIPFAWNSHWERLNRGADFLGIAMPVAPDELRRAADQIIQRDGMAAGILRVQLSRGAGPRGCSPKGADCPRLIMTLHAIPEKKLALRLVTSTYRLFAEDPLLQHKTCNKLLQVLARRDADEAGADETLLLNHRGEVASATSANVFWVSENTVCTPRLDCGALPGITRAAIGRMCARRGSAFHETAGQPSDLERVDAVFLASSGFGIASVSNIDGRPLEPSSLVEGLSAEYEGLVRGECENDSVTSYPRRSGFLI